MPYYHFHITSFKPFQSFSDYHHSVCRDGRQGPDGSRARDRVGEDPEEADIRPVKPFMVKILKLRVQGSHNQAH